MAWDDFEIDGILGFTGDKPLDLLADSLAAFTKLYENRFDRKPTLIELLYTLETVLVSDPDRYIADQIDQENFKILFKK